MRSLSVFFGRLLGVEFRIHMAFLFLLIFVLVNESGRGGMAVARGVALTAMVLFSVLLHELGHALAGARNGLPMKGSVLLPLGGVGLAKRHPFRHSQLSGLRFAGMNAGDPKCKRHICTKQFFS